MGAPKIDPLQPMITPQAGDLIEIPPLFQLHSLPAAGLIESAACMDVTGAVLGT